MENASKALIMAAEILIGVMVISIAVYMFQNFAGYSEETYKQMEQAQIEEFNSQFTKFYGSRTVTVNGRDTLIPIKCTIHEIVGLANLAQKNNKQYEVEGDSGGRPDSFYIQVDIAGIGSNIEKKSNDELTKYIKDNSLHMNGSSTEPKYYKCIEYKIDSATEGTKRVYYVNFKELTDREYLQIRQFEES